MSSRLAAVLALVGCNDAVTLAVSSDRPVPQAIDAICVGVADVDASGGYFGRHYRLEGQLGSLPQTLRVDPGSADRAWAWVRGDRGGVPSIRAGRDVDFSDDVTLGLDRCERGAAGEPLVVGDPVGPASARLVVSYGANGAVVVAFADQTAAVLEVVGGELVAREAPPLLGAFTTAVAADIDGDCDDDLVVATAGNAPELWRRTPNGFEPVGNVGGAAATALAAGDVNRDGFADIITGSGATVVLFRNDGAGGFAADTGALGAEGTLVDVRALALGDLDNDGNPELVAGQAGQPLRGWLGDPSGNGSFQASSALIAPVPVNVVQMQLADVDGDFDPDLAVAVAGGPIKIYVDRQGLLEDQTFLVVADPIPTANAIAIGGWDAGCEPDALLASDAMTESRRGQNTGVFEPDGSAPGARDVVMADFDDDGDLDAVIATPQGALWLAR